jgi:hypothetical protein
MTEPRYGLTDEQIATLLQPVNPKRVQKDKKSKGKQSRSHLAAWDVRRWLTRIFGFVGWSDETLSLDLVHESPTKLGEAQRPGWKVVYRAQVRLVIKNLDGVVLTTFDDGAIGGSNLPDIADAHDMAMKTALSQALKRCAMNLGDQFGLSLYNDGSTEPVVLRIATSDMSIEAAKVAAAALVGDDEVLGDDEMDLDSDSDDYSPPIGVDAAEADAVLFHALKRQTETATTIAELRKAGDRVKEEVKRLTPGQIKELQKAWRDTNVLLIMDAIDGRLEKLRQGDLPATRSIYTEIEKQIDDAGFTVDVTADLKKQLNQAFDEAVEAASAPPPQ